jgi:hypothetical protein
LGLIAARCQTIIGKILEKMMRRLAFAFAAISLSLAPARAADIKTIDCVQKTLDASTVQVLLTDVDRNFQNIDTQTYSEATANGMRVAAQACRTKYAWSDKASEASILYALFMIANPSIRRHAAAAGLDYAKLESRFMALSEIERADALQEAVLDKLATGALDANEMTNGNAKVAGAVFGFLAARSKAVLDFVAN